MNSPANCVFVHPGIAPTPSLYEHPGCVHPAVKGKPPGGTASNEGLFSVIATAVAIPIAKYWNAITSMDWPIKVINVFMMAQAPGKSGCCAAWFRLLREIELAIVPESRTRFAACG
jgi:hypothetical protein